MQSLKILQKVVGGMLKLAQASLDGLVLLLHVQETSRLLFIGLAVGEKLTCRVHIPDGPLLAIPYVGEASKCHKSEEANYGT